MEIDYNDIDFDILRRDLEDYFTGAYFMVSPLALCDLSDVQDADEIKLIKIAQRNNFDLKRYLRTYRR